jgi:hypothetical protein
MSYYLDHGLALFVLVKITLFVFPLIILEWARRHKPVFAKIASRTCIVMYLFLYVSTVIQLNLSQGPDNTQVATAKPITANISFGK